jgi:nitrate/nitrite transporter NarK
MPSNDTNPYEALSAPPISAPLPESKAPSLSMLWACLAIVAAALAMAATLPGRTHALGLITTRLLADFPAISETDYARINLLATLIGSAFCIPAGWLLDRFGPKRVTPFLVLAVAGLAWGLSRVEDVTTLSIVITLLRGIGQSMLSVASLTIIGRAFPKRPGLAMGVYAVLMTILMAGGTGALMAGIQNGWRTAWGSQFIPLVIVAVVIWLTTPSRFGTDPREPSKSSVSSATWQQALSSPCFWVFALATSLFGLVTSGVSLFQQSIFAEHGIPENVYHRTMLMGLAIGLAANLVGGALALLINMGRLLVVAMILLALSLAALPWANQPWHAYAFTVVYTVAGGFITVLFFSIWGHAYGQKELGRIQGMAQMATVIASALGPMVVAESNRLTGSYNAALYACAAVSVLLAVAAFVARVPNANAGDWKPEASQPTLALKENLA